MRSSILFSANAAEQAITQLDEICLIASFAIEQNNLTEELSYLVRHDPLTHFWNRAWMEEVFARTLEAAAEIDRFTGSKPLAPRDLFKWVAARSARSPLSVPDSQRLFAIK